MRELLTKSVENSTVSLKHPDLFSPPPQTSPPSHHPPQLLLLTLTLLLISLSHPSLPLQLGHRLIKLTKTEKSR